MKEFTIRYKTGYLSIVVDNFFPCTIAKAKKLTKLINRYSSDEDKENLITYLKTKEVKYRRTSEFNRKVNLHNRIIRNIEILGGKKFESE